MPSRISRERHHLTPSFMMRGHFDERLIGHAQRRRQNARLVVTFIIPRWQQQQKQQPQFRLFAVEIVRRRRSSDVGGGGGDGMHKVFGLLRRHTSSI